MLSVISTVLSSPNFVDPISVNFHSNFKILQNFVEDVLGIATRHARVEPLYSSSDFTSDMSSPIMVPISV